jgi:hypothetical protein
MSECKCGKEDCDGSNCQCGDSCSCEKNVSKSKASITKSFEEILKEKKVQPVNMTLKKIDDKYVVESCDWKTAIGPKVSVDEVPAIVDTWLYRVYFPIK